MRFDGIDCQGELLIDRVASLPVWSSAYEGRMVYTEDTERFYIGIVSAWRLLAKTTDNVDLTATAAEINTACYGITASAGELNYMDGITSPLIHSAMVRGGLDRPRFTYKDKNEIYIDAGMYHHSGATEQIVYWDSQLTIPISTASTNVWKYVYLNDAAIVSHGSPLLTASEITFEAAEPTWSDSKGGFYGYGTYRCIFAVYIDGSSSIKKFWHDGGPYVHYDEDEIDLSVYWFSSTSGWIPITLTVPNFGDGAQALLTFWGYSGSNSTGHRPGDGYYRKKGSPRGGHIFIRTRSKYIGANVNQATVTVNEDQQIEIAWEGNQTAAWSLMTDGYVLPGGM